MKLRHNDSKYFKWGITAFFVVAGSLLFYYIIFHLSRVKSTITSVLTILMPVIFGLVIAYLLTPVLNYIECKIFVPICDKLKIKDSKARRGIIRALSVILSVFILFELVYGLVYMFVSEIVPSIVNIVTNFDNYINNFTNWINKILEDNPDVRDYVVNMIDKYSDEMGTWLNDTLLKKSSEVIKTVSLSIIGVLKVLWNFILGLIISIYILISKEKFSGQAKKVVFSIFDKQTGNIIINNFKFTHRTFSGFISGKVIDSIIIGFLCFIGISIMKMPYAALVSVIIGVTNVIPFFGPYLGAIPSAILIFMVDLSHPLNCIYFLIFILALQQFDGNFLGPRILGESTGLSSFWVIFAIIFFGGLMGVFGMIVGVPLFGVIYAAFRSFINARLAKKDLPIESANYINVCYVDDDNNLHKYVPEYQKREFQKKDIKKDSYEYGNHYLSNLEAEKFHNIKTKAFNEEKINNSETSDTLDEMNTENASKQP